MRGEDGSRGKPLGVVALTSATSEPFTIVVRQLQEGESSGVFRSISLEWDLDTEDAVATAEYRKVGDSEFSGPPT